MIDGFINLLNQIVPLLIADVGDTGSICNLLVCCGLVSLLVFFHPNTDVHDTQLVYKISNSFHIVLSIQRDHFEFGAGNNQLSTGLEVLIFP